MKKTSISHLCISLQGLNLTNHSLLDIVCTWIDEMPLPYRDCLSMRTKAKKSRVCQEKKGNDLIQSLNVENILLWG